MSTSDGVFPFGLPARRCAPRRCDAARAVVLGVYPSALHVRWTAPEGFRGITALAVAPEPWPFWDGEDEVQRVEAWQRERGWSEDWGRVAPAGRVNGSSGQLVRDRVLAPLGLNSGQVWLTDALPFFFVHQGPRTQGAAMRERYDPFAIRHELPLHELPARPSTKELVDRAVREEGERLHQELREAGAPLLITLGNEALAVAAALLQGALPERLQPGPGYGDRVTATLGVQRLEVLPLVHPGQRGDTWVRAHQAWQDRQRTDQR